MKENLKSFVQAELWVDKGVNATEEEGDKNRELEKKFGFTGQPAYLIIDPYTGKAYEGLQGPFTSDEKAKIFLEFLNKNLDKFNKEYLGKSKPND